MDFTETALIQIGLLHEKDYFLHHTALKVIHKQPYVKYNPFLSGMFQAVLLSTPC